MNESIIKQTINKVNESIKSQKVFVHNKLQKIKFATDPSTSEMERILGLDSESKKQGRSSTNSLRFILDKRKNHVYMWASGTALHEEVAEAIDITYVKGNTTESHESIFGNGKYDSGKILIAAHAVNSLRKYFNKNEDSPLKKYFTGLNL